MNKLTDAEIVKGLECCGKEWGSCNECPYDSDTCITTKGQSLIMQDTLDLIKRKDAKIERLKAEIVIRDKIIDERGKEVIRHDNAIRSLHKQLDNLKAEAINDFIKKCKEKQEFMRGEDNKYKGYVSIEDLESLKKCD